MEAVAPFQSVQAEIRSPHPSLHWLTVQCCRSHPLCLPVWGTPHIAACGNVRVLTHAYLLNALYARCLMACLGSAEPRTTSREPLRWQACSSGGASRVPAGASSRSADAPACVAAIQEGIQKALKKVFSVVDNMLKLLTFKDFLNGSTESEHEWT